MIRLLPCLTMLLAAATAHAAQEYLRVCPDGRTFYSPGTDSCLDVTTRRMQVVAPSGTFTVLQPVPRAQAFANAAAACEDGRLVDVAAIDPAELHFDIFERAETPPWPVSLGAGDFISAFVVSGGIVTVGSAYGYIDITATNGTEITSDAELVNQNGVSFFHDQPIIGASGPTDGTSTVRSYAQARVIGPSGVVQTLQFVPAVTGVQSITVASGLDSASFLATGALEMCFYDKTTYTLMACGDLSALFHQSATITLAPMSLDVSAASIVGVFRSINPSSNPLHGSAKVQACVRNAGDATTCRASNGTISCGTTSATITPGTTGSNGSAGVSCSIKDNGDGTATHTCPDGSSLNLLTQSAR